MLGLVKLQTEVGLKGKSYKCCLFTKRRKFISSKYEYPLDTNIQIEGLY